MRKQIKNPEKLLDFLRDKFLEESEIVRERNKIEDELAKLNQRYEKVADDIMIQLPIPLTGEDGLINTSTDVYYCNDKENHKVIESECGPWGMDRTNISYSEILPMIVRFRKNITLELLKKYLNKEDKK